MQDVRLWTFSHSAQHCMAQKVTPALPSILASRTPYRYFLLREIYTSVSQGQYGSQIHNTYMIRWKLLKQPYQGERDFQLWMHHCRNRLSTRLHQDMLWSSQRTSPDLPDLELYFSEGPDGTGKDTRRRDENHWENESKREGKKRKEKVEGIWGRERDEVPHRHFYFLISSQNFNGSSLAQFSPYHLANCHRLCICLAAKQITRC